MNKYILKQYFDEPKNNIAKRMIYKSDNVIAFILNIAKDGILPAHTHLESTLLLQVLEGNAIVTVNGHKNILNSEQLMQIDGQETMEVENIGEDILRLLVTISPIGTDKFATNIDI